ncbi:DMT family transporter [Poseidonibacter ostreae]|jgi:drug/metabolite transporter (DMT)-like permease|uniref:EamA family transporter n=1 Tax=Poseidonibacter ostreae TaxID=2654171 RepID=A0A6L4WQD8_9BACT|nr:DMT family transporter [Poseidonibacter ostreae]KAB7885826.1 EamA family transporter [Poseidonibacter ostreae]KAB7886860.1 EamA family transporter [Poseidonibacter ostreae]KAB7889935.1 EamA family transporter [Poseidonibacter ostreae]MAC84206.1 EamA family transporter [Arcobacter sp.]|tara:strand:- start:2978 stop:3817 length:840 start_codon:yes stop_codon:yes gene_type:complete
MITINLTILALLFLALNSILCKVALVNNYIDAYSFTFYRLFFGALTLVLIYYYKNRKLTISLNTNWLTSFMLFVYAICFSYSYISLDAGLGTLLLFGVVQVTMLISSQFLKEKISLQKIIGMIIAFTGLVYLLYPKESFELSYIHVLWMILSGIAWAFYSILGKKSIDAMSNTMDNFIKATFFAIIFYLLFNLDNLQVSSNGILLALISGSLTSAIGYVIWYKVLPQMQIITASVIQLFVPIISIVFSVIFLNELFTFDLALSTVIISIGVLLSILSRK